ncbi:MAG: OsmC family peroxiredoxin [Cytophagales bacterium]|nr:MAG: OsmC family peroxiredoxin [Cytophagales bacterium]
MNTVETVYLGELRTQATHVASQNSIFTDAPVDNQGKGEAFSPTDLVAAALGSCMMTIMGIEARTLQIDLSETKISITKIMAANPRRIAEIKIQFDFPKHLDLSESQQKHLINAARNCPVSKSLHPDLKENLVFNF